MTTSVFHKNTFLQKQNWANPQVSLWDIQNTVFVKHSNHDFVTQIENYDLAVGGEKSMRIP